MVDDDEGKGDTGGSIVACSLANIAVIEEGQAMDQANIISGTGGVVWTKYFIDNGELVSLPKMKKLWEELGVTSVNESKTPEGWSSVQCESFQLLYMEVDTEEVIRGQMDVSRVHR